MSKRTDILAAAEKRVRTGGYDNFSFRDIAADVGIKSASVHYHFPTKGSLGQALVADYTHRFFAALETDDHAEEWLSHYIAMFRRALVDEQLMCLCGLLGAESDGVPEEVNAETKVFFERNLQYLVNQLEVNHSMSQSQAANTASLILSALEGAMIVAKATGDNARFDQAIASLQGFISQ